MKRITFNFIISNNISDFFDSLSFIQTEPYSLYLAGIIKHLFPCVITACGLEGHHEAETFRFFLYGVWNHCLFATLYVRNGPFYSSVQILKALSHLYSLWLGFVITRGTTSCYVIGHVLCVSSPQQDKSILPWVISWTLTAAWVRISKRLTIMIQIQC